MGFFEEDNNENLKMNFKIDEDVAINPVEFQTFNGEFCGNRVICQLDRVNGVRVLTYTVPANVSLMQFLRKKLYAAEFISLFCNVLKQLIFFEDNNMPIKKILLNSRYINVDLTNLIVQFIYMPIDKNFSECNIREFFVGFLASISCADEKCQEYLTKISNYINSEKEINIKTLYKYILNLVQVEVMDDTIDVGDGETTVLKNNYVKIKAVTPYLVRIRTNELIHINKLYFNVGKGSDSDYQIVDNKRVSRKHCTFRVSNGQCFVRDNGSTNQTHVNDMLLVPDKEVLLKNDDYIKMADEEFKYWEK